MHLPGYFSLRNANNTSTNADWTLLYRQDRNSGQFRDHSAARTTGDFDLHKDQLRQTMLKRETDFQHQLHELHRLYHSQHHTMNENARGENRPGTFLGGFTSCGTSENRRKEWCCPVSDYAQSMSGFKISESFGVSKCDQTRRRSYDGVLETPADTRNHFATYGSNGNDDASSSRLHSTKNVRMIDLNESFPNNEPSPRRQNMMIGTSNRFGGSFPGQGERNASAFPETSCDNITAQRYKTPQREHVQQYSNSSQSQSRGKNKIFGVDISEKSSSENGYFKLLGFTVHENKQEPSDLQCFSGLASKPNFPASVLIGDSLKPKITKPEEKQLVNSFSSSPASVLPYGGNSGNAESIKTDHIPRKAASVNGFSNSKLLIDLNSCAEEGEEEEEVGVEPSSPRNRSTRIEIELEAPASCPDTESSQSEGKSSSGNECLNQGDDATLVAAEALLSISAPSHANLVPFQCLVDVISSHGIESATSGKDTASIEENMTGEMDYFKYMTLKQQPNITVEEPGSMTRARECLRTQTVGRKPPRRRQARRGRKPQKKNFQRDVLPMLASLSRNEAVEDLHAMGDMIRDTEDEYTESGSTRLCETGSGTCRKRPVDGCEETSLVGWGKRTRRPTRQST